MKSLAFVILASTTGVAAAQPALTKSSYVVEGHAIGIAVNEPLGWYDANAVGVSAYVAIDEHQVIRANFATWNHAHTFGYGIPGLTDASNGGKYDGGRYTDGGVSWMYFPRKAYDGFSLELGVLARHRNTFDVDDFSNIDTTKSNLYAGRILVGWSWLIKQRAFISAQVGLSLGIERGTLTITDVPSDMTPPSVTTLDPTNVSTEGMVRFGFLL